MGEEWLTFFSPPFTDDFEALCNVLRPPAYGPPRPGGFGLPYEYGPDLGPPYQGLPYGPEVYPPPVLPYDPYPPPPGPFARREAPYGAPPFDMPDFEDDGDPYDEPEAPPLPGPGPRWRYRPRDTRGSFPEPEEAQEGGGYTGEHWSCWWRRAGNQVCREERGRALETDLWTHLERGAEGGGLVAHTVDCRHYHV